MNLLLRLITYQYNNSLKNSLFRRALVAVFAALFSVQIFAGAVSEKIAKVIITGTVISATDNLPIPGVSVLERGTNNGTITDVNGTYRIEVVSFESVLIFSSIGYETQEISISGKTTVNVTLKEKSQELDQVVVVGYGTQRKSDLTSSIAKVTVNQTLKSSPVTGVEQLLQGRAAGVVVNSSNGTPGSPMTVRIRGISTINNNDPIYIVDGVIVNSMNYLNPSDIESMEVLKDASSAAIYGSRAANGVVLITTKKGRSGKTLVSFDSYYAVNSAWKDYKPAGRDEYLFMVKSVYGELSEQYNKVKAIYDKGYYTNWWKEMVRRNTPTQSYNLNLSGGTDKLKFSISGGYFDQNGLISPSNYNRLSFRVNTDMKMNNWLKVGENLSLSRETYNTAGADILTDIAQWDPLVPVLDPNKPAIDQADPYNKFSSSTISPYSSPAAKMARAIGDRKELRVIGNAFAEITILKKLTFNTNIGVNLNRVDRWSFGPTYFLNASDKADVNQADAATNSDNNTIFTNTLTWNQSIAKHNFIILAGASAENTSNTWLSGRQQKQPSNEPKYQFIDAGSDIETMRAGGSASYESMLSYFSRLNYNFDNKYLFAASIRRDGSSKFTKANRWGTFPSLSGGWVISKEAFMANLEWLDFLKLKAGWGQLGNAQSVPADAYATFINTQTAFNYVMNGKSAAGFYMSNLGNTDIKWETAEQSNIGLDLGFLKNTLLITAEFYSRRTKDMLLAIPVAQAYGVSNPWVNAGDMRNNGMEFTISYNGKAGDFNYSISGNLGHYENEVTSLGSGQPIVEDLGWQLRVNNFSRTEVGKPVGYYYGWKTDGIFQSIDEVNSYVNNKGQMLQANARPGDFRFVDVNDDGQIDEKDKTDIGSPHPKFNYGSNIDLNYKSLDFSIFIQGVYGNKLFNGTKYSTDQPNGFYNIREGVAYSAWTPENQSNTNPVMSNSDPNNNYRASDYYVGDGSYLRIKNLQLGYSLPKSITGKLAVEQFRIFIGVQNLLTITNYSGLDPEVGAFQLYDRNSPNQDNINKMARLQGVDNLTFPQPRTVQFGVNLKF